MKFGGLQKNSLIDYPGKISCVLFTAGCNFSCPYCHNPSLVASDWQQLEVIDEDSALAFLRRRQGLLDGVVISGGEPTLQKGLANFCKKVKNLGFSIKLDTNGSNPEVVTCLAGEKLVDYIAMDIKSDLDGYSALWKQNYAPERIAASILAVMNTALAYEFRTTCVRPFVDKDIMARIAKLVEGAPLFVLQRFRDNKLLNPVFFEDGEAGFSDAEMKGLLAVAAPFVQHCMIR